MSCLLLLHGFLGGPASWSEVRAHLPGQRALCPWLPGHGRPPRAVPGDFWQAVDALAAELSEPAFVVGYSLGGRLALGLSCRYPRRTRGVIAVGAHLGLADAGERRARRAWEEEQASALERLGLPSFVAAWEELPLFASQRALPAASLAAQRTLRLTHDATALARVLRLLGTGRMPRLRPESSGVPTLLVTGQLDEKLTLVARARPGLRHVQVDGAGHNPVLEAPGALARLIGQTLRAWSQQSTQENHA